MPAARRKKKYQDVVIDLDTKKRVTRIKDVTLLFNQPGKPDSVRWIIPEFPPGATRVAIKWEVDSPFLHLGTERPVDMQAAVLLATGNTREPGVYKYNVLFMDDDDVIVGGVDPIIKNDPTPPPST
jgi:hypothetical protein